MPCGATQDGQVVVKRSDRMWSTGEGNGKPLQYSCLENPVNSSPKLDNINLFLFLLLFWSEVAQSYPTLWDPVDCSLPGSSTHGILQTRILEWVSIAFSRGSSWPRDWTWVSHIGGRCFNLWATGEALAILRDAIINISLYMLICLCAHDVGGNSRIGIVSKPWTFSRLLINFLRLIFGTII